MSQITEWANSQDRTVTVLAAPGGVPLEVRLSPSALQQRPDVLARTVLNTAAAAGRRATARLHRELAATVGAEAIRTLDRVGLPVPQDGTDSTDSAGDSGGTTPHGQHNGEGFGSILYDPYGPYGSR